MERISYPLIQCFSMSNYNENRKLRDANANLIHQQYRRGFKPIWYCVIHLDNQEITPKYERRRLNLNDECRDDAKAIKNILYSKIYGKKWRNNSRRARSMWSLEYGKLCTPHINLIMEKLPSRYNSQEQLVKLLDIDLPRSLRCLPRRPKTCTVDPIYNEHFIANYMSKEVKVLNKMWTYPNPLTGNSDVLHELNDYEQDLNNKLLCETNK